MISKFVKLFQFRSELAFRIGAERERFLVDLLGRPIPVSKLVLRWLPEDGRFTYELSAAQLEDRVGPIYLSELIDNLRKNDEEIADVLNRLNIAQAFYEVADADMDLSVYDDPTGRYQRIVKNMPKDTLLAACRVAGTHVHIGMQSMEQALTIYNRVISRFDELCSLINNSDGQRLEIYKTMAPDFMPRRYETFKDFYQDACEKGFDKDPRKNWQLIRITVHGTIEFRMGGATASYDEIYNYAKFCHDICAEAMPREIRSCFVD
jgi:hypothetical protein